MPEPGTAKMRVTFVVAFDDDRDDLMIETDFRAKIEEAADLSSCDILGGVNIEEA